MSARPPHGQVRHKYKNLPTEHNGQRYDSKAEAKYAAHLDLLKRAGQVLFYLRQVPFHLPGRTRYVVDFAVFYADGRVSFVDVKGMETQSFRAKKRMVEDLYAPVEIEVVR